MHLLASLFSWVLLTASALAASALLLIWMS
jgi:hypothetical protein